MEWNTFLRALADHRPLSERMALLDSALQRQEATQQAAAVFAQAYVMNFAQDVRHPQFVTYSNAVFPGAATNPDFAYHYAVIDGDGTYRLTGTRGNSLFVLMAMVEGVYGTSEQFGPVVGDLDLDDLNLDADGSFSVLISRERPDEYTGDWWQLAPNAAAIMVRQASYDWGGEVDARLAIERLDQPPAGVRLDATGISHRLEETVAWTGRFLNVCHSFAELFGKIPVNTLTIDTFPQFGGLLSQSYYQGPFEIAADEALIIETRVPEQVRYWGVVLVDELFNTIDWVNNQSTLNGFQARLDADGRFRAVLSIADPGVPNWLDPVGRPRGFIQGRWLSSISSPTPSIRRIKLAALRDHLPADTPEVSPDQRDEALRARRRGAQLRRKW